MQSEKLKEVQPQLNKLEAKYKNKTSEEDQRRKTEEDDESEEDDEDEDSAEVKAVKAALKEDEEAERDVAPVDNAEEASDETDEDGNRVLSEEEEEVFAAYLNRKSTRRQIAYALDNMSMAAYTGNIIITGEEGVGTIDLAKRLIRQMQSMDANCTGPVAKITGKDFNYEDMF